MTPLPGITCYTYDVLDNLIQVRQNADASCTSGGQVRTFVYDTLSRLRTATNPESGTITYTYDDNGNLKTRLDARGVLLTNTYDQLNRLKKKVYTGGGTSTSQVDYTYGTAAPEVGRLKKVVTAGVGERRYSYDKLGRITSNVQEFEDGDPQVANPSYAFGYAYNLDDTLKTMTYPSTKVVAYDYDAAGRSRAAGLDAVGATEYLNPQNIAYAPHGAPKTWQLGNGVVETTGYNARLQPVTIDATKVSSLLTLGFGYESSQGAGDNNGNVKSQTINAGGTNFSQSYTYDGVNRIETMSEGALGRNYAYDAYGNRAMTGSQTGPATPYATSVFNAATNRLVTTADPATNWAEYDDAGNLTQFLRQGAGLQWSAAYDAENKQRFYCGFATASCTAANADAEYVYDGEGNRVRKIDYDSGAETTYVYDALGRLAAEYSTAAPAMPAGRYFRTTDHLGSTRLVTNSSGGVVSRHDFFPFGEQIDRSGIPPYDADSAFRQMFTAKERDEESDLDYFLARYYSGALGRFTSVDPENAGALGGDPQSWNGYAYVTNRPLTLTDPDGRCPWCVGALIGGAAGGLINAGLQLAFTGEIKGNQVLASAAAGFAAGATLGVLAPAATTTILSVTGVEATIGASGTAGAVALGVTPAAASGIVGGVTGRAIEAGGSLSERLNAATANPTEIVKDAATGVVVNGVVGAAEAGVQAGRTAGVTQNLERQVAARTRPGAPANSPRVTNQRIQQLRDSQQKLSGQQETAGRVASAGATLIVEDEKMRDQLGVGR